MSFKFDVCADLCQGRGVLLANQTRTQQLESELAILAPKLSSLTVLLRTTVLPAISLVNPEAATRLQVVRPILSHHAIAFCGALKHGRHLWPCATLHADSAKSSHHKQSIKRCVQCIPMIVLINQQH